MFLVHTTTVLVWVFAVPRLLGHGQPLSVGVFVSFLLYTTMFVSPIEVIGQMARTINRATSSAHRVFDVLDSEPEVRDAERMQCNSLRCVALFRSRTSRSVTTVCSRCCAAFRSTCSPGELIGSGGFVGRWQSPRS